MIIRDFNICIIPNASIIQRVINVNQYDKDELWRFTLSDENGIKIVPTDASIIGIKPDNKIIAIAGTIDEIGRVCITETEQMTAVVGISKYEITFDGGTHGTYNFNVSVEEKPGADGIVSDSEIAIFQQAISKTTAAAKTATEQATLSKKYAGEAKNTADALSADTTAIKTGISQIAENIETLKSDFAKTKTDVDTIKSTITLLEAGILEKIYPVGSLYLTESSTNPSELFGFGKWVKIEDKFLIGASSNTPLRSTGGSFTHKHGTNASVNGTLTAAIGAVNNNINTLGYDAIAEGPVSGFASATYIFSSNATPGSSGTHWNHGTKIYGETADAAVAPPYYAVNIWRRTA